MRWKLLNHKSNCTCELCDPAPSNTANIEKLSNLEYRRGKLVVSKGCKDCHSTKEDASYVPILPAKMDRMPQEIYNEKCNIARMKWLELIVVTDNDLDRIKKHFTIFLREVGLVP